MLASSFSRRQQYRRLRRAGARGACGIAFAIEVKTGSSARGQLARVRSMAVLLSRRRRRWCRRGALPVLCVVRARAVERIDDGVLIVTLDRLLGALRTAAGMARRPGFIAADVAHR
jgi:hypothetical protein